MSFDEQANQTISVLDKVVSRSKAHYQRNLPSLHQPQSTLDNRVNDMATKADFLRKPRKTSAYNDAFGSSLKLSTAAGTGNLHQYSRSKQGVEANSRFLEPENHQFSMAH